MKTSCCAALKSWGQENGTAIAGWIGAFVAAALSFWFIHLGAGKKLDHVGTWILSANFAAAFFAINFAFIGYNLSPYSKLWRRLSWSHWVLILLLLSLPTLPIIALLLQPDWVWSAAVAISPWVTFLSAVTYFMTGDLIDPRRVLKVEYTSKAISGYCWKLAATIEEDSKQQKAANVLPIGEQPMHMSDYRPNVIEAKHEPLWDRLMIVFSVAIDAHDYEVFEIAFDRAFAVYKELLRARDTGESRVAQGLQYVAERRFKSLLVMVGKSSSDRIFMEAINSRLCVELTSAESLRAFKEKLPMSIMGMLEAICRDALVGGKDYDALKSLNAIHTFTGVAAAEARKNQADFLAPFSVAAPIDVIKRIGSYAVTAGDVDALYRCLEALEWLGCGIAARCGKPDHREEEPLKACISSLVQLGREARHKKLQCFWERCILPPHIHAEEKMGSILNLLEQIPARNDDEQFFLEGTITEAYSRIRGFMCRIEPDKSFNPKFWIIDEKDKSGKPVPCTTSMMGGKGYNWTIDYSDVAELKEYTLH
jgi:hypothetical protein